MTTTSTPRTEIALTDLAALVETCVLDHVGRAATFTAYDITQALRTANPSTEIRHDAVKGMAHTVALRSVSMGAYERNKQGRHSPFVYSPKAQDAGDSDSDVGNGDTAPVADSAVVPDVAAPVVAPDADDLNIPDA